MYFKLTDMFWFAISSFLVNFMMPLCAQVPTPSPCPPFLKTIDFLFTVNQSIFLVESSNSFSHQHLHLYNWQKGVFSSFDSQLLDFTDLSLLQQVHSVLYIRASAMRDLKGDLLLIVGGGHWNGTFTWRGDHFAKDQLVASLEWVHTLVRLLGQGDAIYAVDNLTGVLLRLDVRHLKNTGTNQAYRLQFCDLISLTSSKPVWKFLKLVRKEGDHSVPLLIVLPNQKYAVIQESSVFTLDSRHNYEEWSTLEDVFSCVQPLWDEATSNQVGALLLFFYLLLLFILCVCHLRYQLRKIVSD